MSAAPATISIALLSHTNAGKTTLARTLLRRDIGAVMDRAHVTEVAEEFELMRSAAGDRLLLWDTPGFGDSVRLQRRLAASGQPLGWFLSQVWDRYADRAFWCSQQALRAARDSADVVLYVVNATEDPAAAGYVEPELRILDWLGRPALLLLNQLGTRGDPAQDQPLAEQWGGFLRRQPTTVVQTEQPAQVDEGSDMTPLYIVSGVLLAGAVGTMVWTINRNSELSGCDQEEFFCKEEDAVSTQRTIAPRVWRHVSPACRIPILPSMATTIWIAW